jgi:hypothetical protein
MKNGRNNERGPKSAFALSNPRRRLGQLRAAQRRANGEQLTANERQALCELRRKVNPLERIANGWSRSMLGAWRCHHARIFL